MALQGTPYYIPEYSYLQSQFWISALVPLHPRYYLQYTTNLCWSNSAVIRLFVLNVFSFLGLSDQVDRQAQRSWTIIRSYLDSDRQYAATTENLYLFLFFRRRYLIKCKWWLVPLGLDHVDCQQDPPTSKALSGPGLSTGEQPLMGVHYRYMR